MGGQAGCPVRHRAVEARIRAGLQERGGQGAGQRGHLGPQLLGQPRRGGTVGGQGLQHGHLRAPFGLHRGGQGGLAVDELGDAPGLGGRARLGLAGGVLGLCHMARTRASARIASAASSASAWSVRTIPSTVRRVVVAS